MTSRVSKQKKIGMAIACLFVFCLHLLPGHHNEPAKKDTHHQTKHEKSPKHHSGDDPNGKYNHDDHDPGKHLRREEKDEEE